MTAPSAKRIQEIAEEIRAAADYQRELIGMLASWSLWYRSGRDPARVKDLAEWTRETLAKVRK